MRELWRFILVMVLGVVDALGPVWAVHLDLSWATGRDLLPAITIAFRFSLWSAAAFIAIGGRKGVLNVRR